MVIIYEAQDFSQDIAINPLILKTFWNIDASPFVILQ